MIPRLDLPQLTIIDAAEPAQGKTHPRVVGEPVAMAVDEVPVEGREALTPGNPAATGASTYYASAYKYGTPAPPGRIRQPCELQPPPVVLSLLDQSNGERLQWRSVEVTRLRRCLLVRRRQPGRIVSTTATVELQSACMVGMASVLA